MWINFVSHLRIDNADNLLIYLMVSSSMRQVRVVIIF